MPWQNDARRRYPGRNPVHLSAHRRVFPGLAAAMLVSAAVAVLSVPATQSARATGPTRPAARTAPADLYRGQQWTLDALHIPHAWKYSRGNGVTVAVLDTGVDGHQPDLTGRVIDGPDFTGHDRRPGSRFWGRHGTSMASIISGHGHGPGAAAGIMGVAPDAKILSIRVTWELGDPARADHAQVEHSRDAIAQGIRYAADHGAQVISMSLGGGKLFYDGNPLEEAAIKYAETKGVVLVASAGNDGNAANRRNYPAAYPDVIAVGAVDRAFRPATFTNRHTYVSVASPGVEIVSADVAGHGYILGTGTSSSAAFVAGMSALIKARYPALTPPEVRQALEEGATHRPPDGRSTSVGTGVADALGSLRMAAHINRAEHGGAAVREPGSTTSPQSNESGDGPDLMLIAVLSGGGTLLVLSLILGWRQRRRRPDATEGPGDEAPEETDPSPPARTRVRTTSRSAEQSPWERRGDDGAHDLMDLDMAAWERQSSSPEVSPWERRPAEASPSPELAAWDAEQAPPSEITSWDADPLPLPDLSSLDLEPEKSSWETDQAASLESEQASPWDPLGSDPLPAAWDTDRPSLSENVLWDLDPSSGTDEAASTEAGSWDSSTPQPSSRWDLPSGEPSTWDRPSEEPSAWDRPTDEPSASGATTADEPSSWDRPLDEPSASGASPTDGSSTRPRKRRRRGSRPRRSPPRGSGPPASRPRGTATPTSRRPGPPPPTSRKRTSRNPRRTPAPVGCPARSSRTGPPRLPPRTSTPAGSTR
jgi:serine protease